MAATVTRACDSAACNEGRVETTNETQTREKSRAVFTKGLYPRIKLIRERVVRAVSPHPDPLPQGEGTARIAQCKAGGCGLFSAEERVHPLPKGEGWGEGKETTAPRSADLFALARGQCAQCYMALSHS